MKRKAFLILSLLVVLAISATPAMGDGGTMNTAFAVQNLGDSEAHVEVEFRNTAGILTATLSETIPEGQNFNFDQRYGTGDPGEDPFQGSVIVSSGEPIGAVANVMRTGGTPSYESYNGLGSAEIGENISLPQILKNVTSAGLTWNTTIVIQNTNTTSSVSVDVIFTPYPDGGLGTAFTKTISVPAGGAYYMDQADEPTDGQIGATFYGSAKVEAASAVGVAVYSDGGGQILMAYPSYRAGTTDPIGLPSIYKEIVSLGDSYSTAVLVVNLGDAEAAIEIEYLPASGDYTVSGTDSFTIPVNGVKNIDQRYHAASITSATFLGGAILRSTNGVPIAAMVNLRGGSRYGMTYGGLMNSGNEAYLPISYKEISSAGYSWSSTIIVYNFGAPSDASVNFTFYPSAGSPIVDPGTYTVSQVEQFDLRYTTAIASETTFFGSVKVESNQPIGVLVQTRGAGGAGDALMAFQGLMP